jgi:ATP-dependent DNA helicase PIF1
MNANELIGREDFQYGAIFGPAGSGKTYLLRQTLALEPSWGIFTATTGAAARCLGPEIRTVHSTLGFFDLKSVKASHDKGDLHDVIRNLRKTYERLIIDEVSMLGREMFEILVDACADEDMGLILVGDFLQLAPIPDNKGWDRQTEWLFESKAWAKFKDNVITLKTQHRFSDNDYIQGINCLRSGKGLEAVAHFRKAGVTFLPKGTPSDDFEGTIITGKKDKQQIINEGRFAALQGEERAYVTTRSGKQITDWAAIPDAVTLKVGARVMILRNLYDESGENGGVGRLLQANGELGTVTELLDNSVMVERDDKTVVEVEMMEGHNGIQHKGHDGEAHTKVVDRRPTGFIEYMPLTLAWAMNCHKVQGLSLFHPTRVVFEDFFKTPAMVYVAVSRVADPKHLTLVGADTMVTMHGSDELIEMYDEPRLATLCNMDSDCARFV